MREVSKVTSNLRNSFGQVYATYALTYYSAMFLPYFILNISASYSTKPFTLAFSNTPGLLKPITFEGKKSIKTQNYVIPGGHTGLGVSCISYCDYFKIAIVTDDTIMQDPHILVSMIERNIRRCIVSAEPFEKKDQWKWFDY